jgi:hypothetical protein
MLALLALVVAASAWWGVEKWCGGSPSLSIVLSQEELALTAGQSAGLEVRVDRGRCTGPIRLELTGLPDGIQAEPATVAADQNVASIVLTAAADAEEKTAEARVLATLGDVRAEMPVRVALNAAPSLRLLPLAEVSLVAGQGSLLPVRIERRGCAGYVKVRLEGVTAGLRSQSVTIPAGEDSGKLELSADTDQAEEPQAARVVARLGSLEASQSIVLHVRAAPSLRLMPVGPVTVAAGRRVAVEIRLQRRSCEGPVELRLDGLPAALRASLVTIKPGENVGQLEITAGAASVPGEHTGQLVARLGALDARQAVVVRVKAAPSFLLKLSREEVMLVAGGADKRSADANPFGPEKSRGGDDKETGKPGMAATKPGSRKPTTPLSGTSEDVEVRVVRKECAGAVRIWLEGLPAGVRVEGGTVSENRNTMGVFPGQVEAGTIPAEQNDARFTIRAEPGVCVPPQPVRLVAVADDTRAEGSFLLTVIDPPKEQRAVRMIESHSARPVVDERLPGKPVVKVDLSEAISLTDEELKSLTGLAALRELDLRGCRQCTDRGLGQLNVLTGLRQLNLRGTKVTDAGLKSLNTLTALQELDLSKTAVTDDGLASLKALTALKELLLPYGGVTDAGIEDLQKALPKPRIYRSY